MSHINFDFLTESILFGSGLEDKWCSELSKECQAKAHEDPDLPNEMELMKENLRLRKELEEAKKRIYS